MLTITAVLSALFMLNSGMAEIVRTGSRHLLHVHHSDHNTADGGIFMANGRARFTKTIEIAAPRDCVWKVMTDVEHWPDWAPSVTSLRRLDAGPFVIGSRARIKQPRLLSAVWTVTALDAGRSFTWVSRMPGLRVYRLHEVDSAGDSSRVSLPVQFEGAFRLIAARVFGKLNEEYLNMEATGLKRQCESVNAF